MGGFGDRIVTGNDQIRPSVDNLAREIGIARGLALTRISLDCEVLSLYLAQPAQFLEKRLKGASSRAADARNRAGGDDDRNPVLPRPLLRAPRSNGGREQQTDRKIAPPHIAAPAH